MTATALLFLALFSMPAMAYIDPGSGSAILSAIAGFLVAITMVIKAYWYKLKSFFVKPKPETVPNQNKNNESN
jgi:hypothetical protein